MNADSTSCMFKYSAVFISWFENQYGDYSIVTITQYAMVTFISTTLKSIVVATDQVRLLFKMWHLTNDTYDDPYAQAGTDIPL